GGLSATGVTTAATTAEKSNAFMWSPFAADLIAALRRPSPPFAALTLPSTFFVATPSAAAAPIRRRYGHRRVPLPRRGFLGRFGSRPGPPVPRPSSAARPPTAACAHRPQRRA